MTLISINTVFSILFLLITTIIILYLSFVYTKTITENKISEENIRMLEQYIDVLEKNYQDVSDFSHEYINMIQELQICVDTKSLEGLGKLIDEKILPISYDMSRESVLLEKLSFIKIQEVKSAIYAKIIIAKSHKINFILDVPKDIEIINMKKIHIVKILGIIIDNAIESSKNTDEKLIIMGFYHGTAGNYENKETVIVIRNSFNKAPNLQRIFDYGYSTKGASMSRGFGLYEVKQIVDRYDDVLLKTSIDKESDLFVLELSI